MQCVRGIDLKIGMMGVEVNSRALHTFLLVLLEARSMRYDARLGVSCPRPSKINVGWQEGRDFIQRALRSDQPPIFRLHEIIAVHYCREIKHPGIRRNRTTPVNDWKTKLGDNLCPTK